MIGYKAQIINDKPIAFWTFDYDWYDSNKYSIDPNLEIKDEMGNLCPAYLISDSFVSPYKGYQLGTDSLVSIQKSLGKSITFAPFSKVEEHPSKYPWSYLKIPHYTVFNFNKNHEFTLEFFIHKKNETYFTDNIISPNSISRPVMRKAGLFDIITMWGYWANNSVRFTLPNGNYLYYKSQNRNGTPWYDKTHHVVLTWKSEEILSNQFTETGKLYIDGVLEDSKTVEQWDEPTFLDEASFIFIGANEDETSYHQNMNTSPMMLDQIALYDYAISEKQINEHYKKIYSYDDMIRLSLCKNYWKLNEENSTFDFTVNPTNGPDKGYLQGGNSFTFRRQKGPDSLANPDATGFSNGGGIKFVCATSNNLIQTSNYSVSFWFRLLTTKECVLMSVQETQFPYEGFNLKANVIEEGKLYFRETAESPWLVSKENIYNKGNWHYVSIVRNGSLVKMYVDGSFHNEQEYTKYTFSQPNIPLFVGTDSVGNQPSDMNICHFTIHDFALTEMEIERHFSYQHIFRIQGITTIQGIPSKLTIRFYNRETGQLVTTTSSTENDGRYLVNLFNDDTLYIVVFNPNDRSLRRRIYGPIIPSEITDYPIKI